tara:strand:+ start:8370 stop:9101 length:732 start_codon:yes stop_codon:yes gene_type:complete
MGKFIIRLDDACPTMDKKKWDKIEKILNEFNIKPLVAIIPNNEDSSMKLNKNDRFFWKKINRWQKNGWELGVHGLNHKINTRSAGLLGINKKSEFANLSLKKQKKLISQSFHYLKRKKINCKYWIAPFHSFDKFTIIALKQLYPNIIISDGFSFRPFIYLGLRWVPQQLWKFYNIPFGVWTICIHPNYMKEKDFIKLYDILKSNTKKFISIREIGKKFHKRNLVDSIFEFFFLTTLKLKKYIV